MAAREERTARGSLPLTLRARKPGYAVMQRCLEIQQASPARTAMQRFWGRDPLVADAQTWFKGALGEREVARVLDTLGPEWTVLHAVPVGAGASDIDHVVVGPGGVFTINTKNHSGRDVWVGGGSFIVGGTRTAHMRNARFEGERAASMLSRAADMSIAVQPLIVVQCRTLRFGKKRPDVVTLRPSELQKWLRTLPRVFSAEAVAYFGLLAEERGTWHLQAIVINDTLRHLQRFERLEREIAGAASRRRIWKQGAVLAACAMPAGWLLGHFWGLAALALHH